MRNKQRYVYDGPVMIFDRCVANNWHGETMAVSEKQARSNLAYQYKNETGLSVLAANVVLPQKILASEVTYGRL